MRKGVNELIAMPSTRNILDITFYIQVCDLLSKLQHRAAIHCPTHLESLVSQ